MHAVCPQYKWQTACQGSTQCKRERLPQQDCLALGAIFATTDSVAVLQVLEQDRAPLLFNLVFGEGVINDATTVALLRTVQVVSPAQNQLCATGLKGMQELCIMQQHLLSAVRSQAETWHPQSPYCTMLCGPGM